MSEGGSGGEEGYVCYERDAGCRGGGRGGGGVRGVGERGGCSEIEVTSGSSEGGGSPVGAPSTQPYARAEYIISGYMLSGSSEGGSIVTCRGGL